MSAKSAECSPKATVGLVPLLPGCLHIIYVRRGVDDLASPLAALVQVHFRVAVADLL